MTTDEKRALAALKAIYDRMVEDNAAGDEAAMEWIGEVWPALVPADIRAKVGDTEDQEFLDSLRQDSK